MEIRNKYKKIAWRSLLIFSLIGFGAILYPDIAGIDGMDGGFALYVLGGFVLMIGLIVFIVYARMASLFKRISQFQGVIAKWVIPQADYSEFAIYDYKETVSGHKATRWLISIISLVVGVLLIIMGLEVGIIAVIIISLIALMWIVSFIAIAAAGKKLKIQHGEVLMSREGAIINGSVHNWSSMGGRLEGIELGEIKSGLNILNISYSTPGRYSRNTFTARFPVPRGREAEAASVAAILKEFMATQNI